MTLSRAWISSWWTFDSPWSFPPASSPSVCGPNKAGIYTVGGSTVTPVNRRIVCESCTGIVSVLAVSTECQTAPLSEHLPMGCQQSDRDQWRLEWWSMSPTHLWLGLVPTSCSSFWRKSDGSAQCLSCTCARSCWWRAGAQSTLCWR